MKTIFIFLVILTTQLRSGAQGSLETRITLSGGNVVPPNASSANGYGVFRVEESSLHYIVGWDLPFSPTGGGIYGGAESGQNANLLYDIFVLGHPFDVAPNGQGSPGSSGYDGVLNLTGSQKAELTAGLWNVSLNSDSFPNGEIRGQIPAVPEPSTPVLLCLGLGVIGLGFWRKSP